MSLAGEVLHPWRFLSRAEEGLDTWSFLLAFRSVYKPRSGSLRAASGSRMVLAIFRIDYLDHKSLIWRGSGMSASPLELRHWSIFEGVAKIFGMVIWICVDDLEKHLQGFRFR
jgi:hypothetical protein